MLKPEIRDITLNDVIEIPKPNPTSRSPPLETPITTTPSTQNINNNLNPNPTLTSWTQNAQNKSNILTKTHLQSSASQEAPNKPNLFPGTNLLPEVKDIKESKDFSTALFGITGAINGFIDGTSLLLPFWRFNPIARVKMKWPITKAKEWIHVNHGIVTLKYSTDEDMYFTMSHQMCKDVNYEQNMEQRSIVYARSAVLIAFSDFRRL
ncbi:hypothetical protein M5689_019111 [Euphorbia peplus]|nr:hypothetical protein M5689_019111 [Euphorbia peplus]